MKNLHDHQSKILEYLLSCHEGASLDELAIHLELTRTAVQQHVLKLQDLGYLTHLDTKGSVGRPRRRYLISDEGIDVFPKKYSWLATAILAQLAQKLGPSGSKSFMRELAGAVARSLEIQVQPKDSPAVRLKKVTGLLNELAPRYFVWVTGACWVFRSDGGSPAGRGFQGFPVAALASGGAIHL